MQIYPFSAPIILTPSLFSQYGGRTGTFNSFQLNSSFLLAEIQVTNYLQTPLLPVIVTGTYSYTGLRRLVTDYRMVSRLLSVSILTQKPLVQTFDLLSTPGYGFIYDDTRGYIDVKSVLNGANMGYAAYYITPYSYFPPNVCSPYQFLISYEAGLPTGMGSNPLVLEALSIMATIDLNEKEPGFTGMNEGVGDVGIDRFSTLEYSENRKSSALKRTILGTSAKANRAAMLLDNVLRPSKRGLRI